MSSENKAPKKTGQKPDITADELLALMKQAVNLSDDEDGPTEEGSQKKLVSRSAGVSQKSRLSLDENMPDTVRNSQKQADADDTGDVEELISRLVSKTSAQPKKSAASTAGTQKNPETPQTDSESAKPAAAAEKTAHETVLPDTEKPAVTKTATAKTEQTVQSSAKTKTEAPSVQEKPAAKAAEEKKQQTENTTKKESLLDLPLISELNDMMPADTGTAGSDRKKETGGDSPDRKDTVPAAEQSDADAASSSKVSDAVKAESELTLDLDTLFMGVDDTGTHEEPKKVLDVAKTGEMTVDGVRIRRLNEPGENSHEASDDPWDDDDMKVTGQTDENGEDNGEADTESAETEKESFLSRISSHFGKKKKKETAPRSGADETTTVFDTLLSKQAAYEEERARREKGEPDDNAATEVFTPVHLNDTARENENGAEAAPIGPDETSAEQPPVVNEGKTKKSFGRKNAAEASDDAPTRTVPVVKASGEAVEAQTAADGKIYGSQNGEEIDQTDINLMIAFGMNEELKNKVGEDQVSRIEENLREDLDRTAQEQKRTAEKIAAPKFEFTSHDQTEGILAGYKNRYYTLVIRMICTGVMAVLLLLLENAALFHIRLPDFLNPSIYPVIYAMVDLQLVVLCGMTVYRQVIDGVRSIISFKLIPETVTVFILLLSVIYSVCACLFAPRQDFVLYNLPAAIGIEMALVYEFLNLKRDILSFSVVSSKRRKFVVTPVSDATESLEREVFREYVPDDSGIISVGRTDFVDGFFAHTESRKNPKSALNIMLPTVLIAALGFMLLTGIQTHDKYKEITAAYMTVVLTTPFITYAVYSYPFYRASKRAYDNGSAIIGESSLEEYAGSAVISFEDKEVFPAAAINVTGIKVYGNNRIDEVIYSLASSFTLVGGPLAEVFGKAAHDLGHSDETELTEVQEDGFTVSVDTVMVQIGKASYMEKKDFDPPFDPEDPAEEDKNAPSILYIAYGGELAAKVYVQYGIDRDFEKILDQLYHINMCVGIKSFDPNIDDLLLSRKIKTSQYPVKVIRSKHIEDIPHQTERCESGIVSKSSVKDLLRTVALCEKVSAAIRTGMIIKILSMLLGVVAMVFIFMFGNEMTINSLFLSIYQLIWLLLTILVSVNC